MRDDDPLDADLAYAERLLAQGRLGGTLDNNTASQLLERFVAEIRQLGEALDHEEVEHSGCQAALSKAQAEIERLHTCPHCGHDPRDTAITRSVAVDLPDRPVAAPCTISGCHYRALQSEIERLRALVDAVGEKVCEVALRLKTRADATGHE